jgi:hypothetical protein
MPLTTQKDSRHSATAGETDNDKAALLGGVISYIKQENYSVPTLQHNRCQMILNLASMLFLDALVLVPCYDYIHETTLYAITSPLQVFTSSAEVSTLPSIGTIL